MGNHAVGRAMVAIAETIAERRKDGETALEILDIAADRSEVRGMDAEFDDAADDDTAFRALLLEAFGEDYDPATDVDGEGFYEGVWRPFTERYGLC
ncbi:hypothetical protein [Sphingobium sp. TCM1]|uniref:hypothetical protein n=1 Tax=Sphingobium sp. TCM1 TaxID=453246 RepID=UPI0007F4E661|nr:hypothetical protein [Sphingobium sp. TCM1]OAN52839.1 hypothetical protein A7Q26_06485 [Sphingobium sp. TCM1]